MPERNFARDVASVLFVAGFSLHSGGYSEKSFSTNTAFPQGIAQPYTDNSRIILNESADVLDQIPFNFLRNEVLFGPNAGFDKARLEQGLNVFITKKCSCLPNPLSRAYRIG